MAFALRMLGSPGMASWESLRGWDATVWPADPDGKDTEPWPAPSAANPLPETPIAHGDNSASISIVKSGRNPTMRHMGRTHGVSVAGLNGQLRAGKFSLGYIKTEWMAADIFTKFYPTRSKHTWAKVIELIGIFPGPDCLVKAGTGGIGHAAAVDRMKDGAVKVNTSCMAYEPDDANQEFVSGYNPFTNRGMAENYRQSARRSSEHGAPSMHDREVVALLLRP